MMEIERLHEMLCKAGIKHKWIDRTPPGYERLRLEQPELFSDEKNWGWQVVINDKNGNRIVSAIEGFGTYGYGGPDHGCLGTTEKDGDLIEIMGLLTPEEAECDSVAGWLTAEDVFERIKKAVGHNG